MPKLKFPALMGIINLTPDSFSDGGNFNNADDALAQAQLLIDQGCTILDLGAESSGPNSSNVSAQTEARRLEPTLKLLAQSGLSKKAAISIDTYKASSAQLGLQYGATIINDVTGLRGDPNLAKIVAKANAQIVIMYSKDPTARTTKAAKQYKDIIQTIAKFLTQQIDYALSQGIKQANIIIDPGMGAFLSSEPKYSFEVLKRLGELKKLGYPILIGTSRKSFLGGNLNQRDIPSLIADSIALAHGADILRTHNPEHHHHLLKLSEYI